MLCNKSLVDHHTIKENEILFLPLKWILFGDPTFQSTVPGEHQHIIAIKKPLSSCNFGSKKSDIAIIKAVCSSVIFC